MSNCFIGLAPVLSKKEVGNKNLNFLVVQIFDQISFNLPWLKKEFVALFVAMNKDVRRPGTVAESFKASIGLYLMRTYNFNWNYWWLCRLKW